MKTLKEMSSDFIVEDNVIKCVDFDYEPNIKGLGYEILGAMRHYKDKIAQYIADTNEVDTYQELMQRSIRSALKMKSLGLTKDDVICMCSTNHRNTFDPFLGAIFLGVKVASIAPQLTVDDAKYLVCLVEPKLIFVDSLGASLMEDVLKQCNVKTRLVAFHKCEQHMSFAEFLKPHPEENTFEATVPSNLMETAIISFSSGTTGLPKGICLNQYMLMYRGLHVSPWFGISRRSGISNYRHESTEENCVILCYSNLYWVSAVLFLITSIFGGAARVVCSEYIPKEFWTAVEKYKMTMVFLSPSQLTDLVTSERPKNADTSSLKSIQTGGASASLKLLAEIGKMFPGVFLSQGYGCTEIAGVITMFDAKRPDHREFAKTKPGSCGYPQKGLWYKVVDVDTGKPLGPHQPGELLVKGKGMSRQFYRDGSSTPLGPDGWLATGDLVYYDEERCFYVVDRLKQVLKVKSYQIAPSVIEGVVEQHPAVLEAVVIGSSDPAYGDLPTAVVVLREDANGVRPEDIRAFVDARVDDLKKLRGGVKFIKELPRTPTGKVKRLCLKEMVAKNQL